MKKTKNYAMPYPEQDDYFNVEDFQDMMVSVDDLMKKLSDSGAQISSDAEHLYNQTKAQMDNIQKRMNAFTALKDGSTTGDAELKDIRVAYDGKEYGNAGEAVREQASDIHKALFGAGASIWSKAKSESKKYVVETKGICILNERFTAAGVVTKISRGTFAENESTLNLDRECSAYIVEFEKNPGTVYMPSAETIKIVSTTKIIFEANGNARCWVPVEKGQYLAVDSTATAYTSESNHVPYMLYDQANETLECRGFGSAGSIEPVDPYSLALEYKLEYDMDDTGLVKQIDANREAADSIKEDISDVFETKKTLKPVFSNGYVNASNGVYDEYSDNGKYAVTDYIKIPTTAYKMTTNAYMVGAAGWATFDKDKIFIKGGQTQDVALDDAVYVRVSDYNSNAVHEKELIFDINYGLKKLKQNIDDKFGKDTKIGINDVAFSERVTSGNIANDIIESGSINSAGAISPATNTWYHTQKIDIRNHLKRYMHVGFIKFNEYGNVKGIAYPKNVAFYDVDSVFISKVTDIGKSPIDMNLYNTAAYIMADCYLANDYNISKPLVCFTDDPVDTTSSMWVEHIDKSYIRPLYTNIPLGGTNILVIGDSLSARGVWQKTLETIFEANVKTHAKGGIGFVEMLDGSADSENEDTQASGSLSPLSPQDVADRDLIIIFGGYNLRGYEEGQKGDLYPTQNTVIGNLQYLINGIYRVLLSAQNLKCRIAVVTPHCAGKYKTIPYDWTQEYPTGSGRTGETLVDSMIECCKHNAIPVLDLYHTSGINQNTWNVFSASSTPMSEQYPNDQLHLNDKVGYPYIGTRIANWLMTI